MIDRRMVFEIHRLAEEGLSRRAIARRLGLGRRTVTRYLRDPHPPKAQTQRGGKLTSHIEEIQRLLALDPKASAVVIRQRLQALGYDGGLTILKSHLAAVRPPTRAKRAFIRFESEPGAQCQVDWGHFGVLAYGDTLRKVYGLAVTEAHSRLLYVEFTHSQKQAALHQILLKAFLFFGGAPKELVSDNMLTAVIEREGRLIRFNEAYLEFLRPFRIVPKACHPGAPWEKGKVEKGAIHYIKHNFWPLRDFRDLSDINRQARTWLSEVANVRNHHTTGQQPLKRFQPQAMRSLPEFLPDCRETMMLKVHSDFAVRFDANTYTVPPWAVGKQVTVKADFRSVSIFHHDRIIAEHPRCWMRRRRIENQGHVDQARRHKDRYGFSPEAAEILSLGEEAKIVLEKLMEDRQPFRKGLKKLIALKQEYGAQALVAAMKKAAEHHALGLSYIENILHQEMTPQKRMPPLILQKEHLNQIRLEAPCLAEYDALVLKRRTKDEGNDSA